MEEKKISYFCHQQPLLTLPPLHTKKIVLEVYREAKTFCELNKKSRQGNLQKSIISLANKSFYSQKSKRVPHTPTLEDIFEDSS